MKVFGFGVVLLSSMLSTAAFSVSQQQCGQVVQARKPSTALSMVNEKEVYSREVMLREEAESPFRKVRFFVYFSLGGGAFTSLFLSLGRIAAGLSGINTDLLTESETNAAVDIAGIVLVAFLWKRDVEAQESRLKRAAKGAELAKLTIRVSKKLADELATDDGTFLTNLASLRRGRGIEKRVVIAAAGKDKIESVMNDAIELNDSLLLNDLVVVPVILPDGSAPKMDEADLPTSVALPAGLNWKTIIDDETAEARSQGVDVESDGIAIVLKKNGRVGQRTKGIYLGNLIGDVVKRQEAGMDIKNI